MIGQRRLEAEAQPEPAEHTEVQVRGYRSAHGISAHVAVPYIRYARERARIEVGAIAQTTQNCDVGLDLVRRLYVTRRVHRRAGGAQRKHPPLVAAEDAVDLPAAQD